MKKILLLITALAVSACALTSQKPTAELPTCQIVDNSQTTIIVGDNNTATPTTAATTTSAPTATMETESINKTSSDWILWIIIGIATLGLGFFLWCKYVK